MTEWNDGYIADIGYTYGYYGELNPLAARLPFANAGIACPEIGTACELGFGQGISTNLHAAASSVEWHGTDFNPAQAGFAQDLARASGARAHLHDDAFADFAARPDLPDFDYIGLHGIWSWISDENRAVIVDFIRRKLKVGGVLYISYNTMPGWSAFVPMRNLMMEHATIMGAKGSAVADRVGDAMAFADRLLSVNPQYLRANPQVRARFDQLKDKSRNYLAHEYFNRDWEPMPFTTMAQWLEPAKLNYVCSAHILDNVEPINLSQEQVALLKDVPDANFRQGVRDLIVNQQFRRDYWVKGARNLGTLEQAEQVRQQRFMLTLPRADVPTKVSGTLGQADMAAAIYGPILDLLADHRPKSFGEIEQAVLGTGMRFNQLLQAIYVLVGQGSVAAIQDASTIAQASKATRRLNSHIKATARGSTNVAHLASPVTGGGINVGRFTQLFLLAIDADRKRPAEWAEYAWQFVNAQGQALVKDGQTIATPEENIAELTRQAEAFANRQLPILKALQVA